MSANQTNREINLIHHLISRQLKPKTKDFFNKISKNTKDMTEVDASDLQGEKGVTSQKCLRRKLPINPCLIICINNTHFQQQKETDQQIIKGETQQTGKVFFLNKTSMGYDQIELIHDSLDIISSINNVIISSSHPNASKIRKK